MHPTIRQTNLLFSFLFLACANTGAQYSYLLNQSARSLALASIHNGFFDISAVYGNQAGLATLGHFTCHGTAIRHYNLEGLSQISMAAVIPVAQNGGTVFGNIFQLGDSEYAEQSLGFGYARPITEQLNASAQLTLLRIGIQAYGDLVTPGIQLSIMGQFTRDLWLGAHVVNPLQLQANASVYIPGTLSVGLLYKVNSLVDIYGEVEKTFLHPLLIKCAVEYNVLRQMTLRLGVSTGNQLASLGLSYKLSDRVVLDIATSYHSHLGITPALSFGYSGKNH